MTVQATLAILVFAGAYVLIATEWVHRVAAAVGGAALMVLIGATGSHVAFFSEETGVDWNVIFLLLGMMIIVGVLRRTGVFEYVAIWSAKRAKGRPFAIMVMLIVITAVASALLDNVTTVVLIGPVTFFLARRLGLSPVPFVISEILASNMGGMATLIGDPPNILIASSAGIDFATFALNMAPLAVIVLIGFLIAARWMFGSQLEVDPGLRTSLLEGDEQAIITDRGLLVRSLVVLGLTLLGFLFHGALHLEPATIALAGAVILMLVAGEDPHEVLREIEWPTLFFFIGLFMLISGVIEIGAIDVVSRELASLTGGSLGVASMFVLWLSAVVSGIVDNIPYTATMLPVIHDLSAPHETQALWWSLAAGADLGGNATIIGASANVILASMAEREGHPIGFMTFARYAVPVTFASILVSSGYLWLRYLL